MAKKSFRGLLLIGVNVFVTFLLLELVLHTDISTRLHVERDYLEGYESKRIRWRENLAPHILLRFSSKNEFDVSFKTNNLGFRGDDFKPKGDRFRVITLGDSFTEGFGATNDSTWQRSIIQLLPDSIRDEVEIYNAGISGSDPVFSWDLYANLLYKYEPDLLVLTINNSDVLDLITRGGNERFTHNGLQFRPAPRHRWLLHSRVARLACRYLTDYAYIPFWKQEEVYREANQSIWKAIEDLEDLGKRQHFELLIVFQPIEWELVHEVEYKFSQLIDRCKEDSIDHIDLREQFRALNVAVGMNKGTLNRASTYLSDQTIENDPKVHPKELYWPVDNHFNNLGYAFFAKGVVHGIMDHYDRWNDRNKYKSVEN